MSDNSPEKQAETVDEISLYEIFDILRRKRRIILGSTIIFALLAGAYGFIRPADYSYQACLSMGMLGHDQNGNPIYIDSPQGAMAQLDNAYLPSTIEKLFKEQKTAQLNTKQFNIFVPKDSSMVCIKTGAPKRLGANVQLIQNNALQQVANDNARITAVSKASAEANIKQLQSTAQTLSSKVANVQDQEQQVSSELTLLKTQDAVLNSQSSKIAQEIDRMRPLIKKGSQVVRDNASAFTMMIQNNQVAQQQQQLFQIEMERSVTLPKERVGLLNQLNALKRQENDLDSKIAANVAQLELAKASLRALQQTRIIRPSSPSIEPMGLGKGVIVVLGAFVGLMLGVFYALLANALSREGHEVAPKS